MPYFDIAVIGGGLVGASFARAISGSNLSTLIIERSPLENSYSQASDNRGLALSYTSKQFLSELNCWQSLVANSFAIKTVHVSEQNSFGFTKLDAATYNLPALGYVVSATNLGKAILHGIENLSNISVMRPAEVNSIEFCPERQQWQMQVAGVQISAALLVIADGGNTTRRVNLGIAIDNTDCQQTAVVTNIFTTQQQISTAYERFTPHGVLALLPFGKDKIKCVWTMPNAYIEKFKAINDQEFLDAVQAAIGFRLGKFVALEERKFFPIFEAKASGIITQQAVLLGNAANTLHPVAAQGFNLGLRDAVTLAHLLAQAKRESRPIDAKVLHSYQQLRQPDHERTRNFTNSLLTIFSDARASVKFSRRIGLLASQFIPPLNRKIITRGLGTWI